MQIYISYARQDQAAVETLNADLERARVHVWMDEELTGGESWWDTNLEQIRACDLYIFALSPDSLRSGACKAELDYAIALDRPLLPVLVRDVAIQLAHPAIARTQMVDYRKRSMDSLLALMAVIANRPPTPPLPDPLPAAPTNPMSYMNEVRQLVDAHDLTYQQQSHLLLDLKGFLNRDEERDIALQLLRGLRQRRDIAYSIAREIDQLPEFVDEYSQGRPTGKEPPGQTTHVGLDRPQAAWLYGQEHSETRHQPPTASTTMTPSGGDREPMEKGKAGRVFISYRRQETAWPAGRLYDELVEHFPAEQVFKDVDNIEPGDDFVERIPRAVGSSDALLVVIGPDWLTITDENGQRRLDNPDDHVRLEIETALQRKIQVIPILVDEARMPRADELPPTLVPLVRRNAVEINPLTFDTKRLITAVQSTLASAEHVEYDQGAHSKRGDLICGVCGTSNPPGDEFCTNCNSYLAWDRSGLPRPAGQPPTPYPGPTPDALVDENVQFTVYRPNTVQPEVWYPLLAFAHLAERRADAPPTQPDPLEQVRALAEQALGDNAAYGGPRVDARGGVPREGQLTFAPFVEGVDFNPRTQTFEWREDVHQQSFRLKARSYAAGLVLRGQLTVYLGAVILADIDLTFRVDIAAPPPPTPSVRPVTLLPNGSPPPPAPQPELTPATANPYDKIFVSYSHKDLDIVRQFEAYGKTLGNDYLRDQLALRSGDEWDERLLQLIDEANIFQLFWSTNSMRSKYVRREWEHALELGRPAFIRPTYWEVPMPHSDNPQLPPDELAKLHFHGFFEELDGGLLGAWPPPQSPPLGSRSVRPAAPSVAASDRPDTRQAASASSMRPPWLIGCAVIIVVVLIALLVVFLFRG